mmetsp:Transcript_947/g.3400  ORF Transcript_947/g.3400 Transcript_947/m.3400 type:complete len:218 (+) Transcript_947:80-733(+)|eukprot:scaffold184_cov379-Prasinococcus_capsulatus_cf.AAC.2
MTVKADAKAKASVNSADLQKPTLGGECTLSSTVEGVKVKAKFNNSLFKDPSSMQSLELSADKSDVGVLTLYPAKKEMKFEHSRTVSDDLSAKITYKSALSKLAGTEGIALEATYKVSNSDKITATHELSKGLKTVKYTANMDFATVEPEYTVASKALSVTLTKKVDSDTYKCAYDLQSKGASLEWSRKPYKVTLKTKDISNPTPFDASVSMDYSYSF